MTQDRNSIDYLATDQEDVSKALDTMVMSEPVFEWAVTGEDEGFPVWRTRVGEMTADVYKSLGDSQWVAIVNFTGERGFLNQESAFSFAETKITLLINQRVRRANNALRLYTSAGHATDLGRRASSSDKRDPFDELISLIPSGGFENLHAAMNEYSKWTDGRDTMSDIDQIKSRFPDVEETLEKTFNSVFKFTRYDKTISDPYEDAKQAYMLCLDSLLKAPSLTQMAEMSFHQVAEVTREGSALHLNAAVVAYNKTAGNSEIADLIEKLSENYNFDDDHPLSESARTFYEIADFQTTGSIYNLSQAVEGFNKTLEVSPKIDNGEYIGKSSSGLTC